MLTWIIVSYPVPFGTISTGGTYTFGVVTAVDDATARKLVITSLAAQGLDISTITPSDIGLVPWDTKVGMVKLMWG